MRNTDGDVKPAATLFHDPFRQHSNVLGSPGHPDCTVLVSGTAEAREGFLLHGRPGDPVDQAQLHSPASCSMTKLSCNGISFSLSTPASQDCSFFGIVSSHSGVFVTVHTWKHGEDSWSLQELEYQDAPPFPIARNNPVLCSGKFYCLGRKGNLGVFDPERSRDDPDSAWRILDKPRPIHAEMELFDDDHEGRAAGGSWLDETEMAWIEVEDINGAALFVDIRASYGVASPEGGHGNRIFLPPVFRGWESDSVLRYGDQDVPPILLRPQTTARVWVVPNLHVDR
ncbi:unnamed protein product [Miscanthus lutarioriparius]|uniref:Uncharacterized protein n=1 Tax=Miscanthus lutarioriparius TaxID=422564 RepID=A0A811PAV8_9POAL|nr:unnamed protein product [Miscanthus lutarioriparius]